MEFIQIILMVVAMWTVCVVGFLSISIEHATARFWAVLSGAITILVLMSVYFERQITAHLIKDDIELKLEKTTISSDGGTVYTYTYKYKDHE